jgi:hypothetical protein
MHCKDDLHVLGKDSKHGPWLHTVHKANPKGLVKKYSKVLQSGFVLGKFDILLILGRYWLNKKEELVTAVQSDSIWNFFHVLDIINRDKL